MNDPDRIAWNRMGDEALKLCGGNLKLYSAKFAEVRREHEARKTRATAKYNLPDHPRQAGSWRIYADSTDTIIEVETDGRSLTQLANLILGLPRAADNSIDVQLALQVINSNFSDLGRLAAGDYLSVEAMMLMRKQNVGPGNLTTADVYGSLYSECLQRAKATNQEVDAANKGAMSEGALRTICWPILKTTQAQYQQRGEIHRYSADNVRYDNNGNLYKTYVR